LHSQLTFGQCWDSTWCGETGGNAAQPVRIYENPQFAVRDIEAQTDGVIAPEAIAAWPGVRLGEKSARAGFGAGEADLEWFR